MAVFFTLGQITVESNPLRIETILHNALKFQFDRIYSISSEEKRAQTSDVLATIISNCASMQTRRISDATIFKLLFITY